MVFHVFALAWWCTCLGLVDDQHVSSVRHFLWNDKLSRVLVTHGKEKARLALDGWHVLLSRTGST